MNEVAAVISSATALVATAVSLFLLRQGQVDRRLLAKDAARQQARQVSGWADWHDPGDAAAFDRPQLPAVFIRNSSDAAVYDVFVDFRAPVDGALCRVAVGPLAPGETRVQDIDYDGQLDPQWEPAALFAHINFRDSAGQRWIRDSYGRLGVDPGPGNDGFFEEGGILLEG